MDPKRQYTLRYPDGSESRIRTRRRVGLGHMLSDRIGPLLVSGMGWEGNTYVLHVKYMLWEDVEDYMSPQED